MGRDDDWLVIDCAIDYEIGYVLDEVSLLFSKIKSLNLTIYL